MSITNEKLVELVQGAKAKDAEAIEFLYNEFYGDVYYICYKILGSHENAEDIAQDTFLEVFTGIDSLTEPLSFRAWVGRIATNKSFNFLKRRDRITIQSPEDVNRLLDVEDIQTSPEDTVIDADVKSTLEHIMSKLPDEQRIALFLYYYREMTVKEIAELFQCPESTIKSRLTYARKFMRKEVERFENEGYKFRCISALPFIPSLYKAGRAAVPAVGKGSIVQAMKAPKLSVPAPTSVTEKISDIPDPNNVFKNNFNVPDQGPAAPNNFNIPDQGSAAQNDFNIPNQNPADKKASKMTKKGKTALAATAAVVVIVGVFAAFLFGINGSKDVPVDTALLSDDSDTFVSENITKDSTENDTDSINEKEEKITLGWEFKETTDQPTFKDSEYVKVKPFTSEKYKDKELTMVTPSYSIDVDKVKEELRKNDILSDKFLFAEGDDEYQYYGKVDTEFHTKYTYNNSIVGYTDQSDLPTDAMGDFLRTENFYFLAEQTFSRYNSPDQYTLEFINSELTQDEIYEITKIVFGEELAEYFVYTEAAIDEDDDSISSDFMVQITTPNSNGTYTLNRDVKRYTEDDYSKTKGTYVVKFMLRFSDEESSGENGMFDFYENGYTPIKMPLALSDMLEADVGVTDFNNPTRLFDKALDFGGEYSTYINSGFPNPLCQKVHSSFMTYDDGTTYSYYQIYFDRYTEEAHSAMALDFSLIVGAFKDSDGNVTVEQFEMELPTTQKWGVPDEKHDEAVAKMLELSQEQAIYVFGIDESLFDNVSTKRYFISSVPIKVFGEEIYVSMSFEAGEDISSTTLSRITIKMLD